MIQTPEMKNSVAQIRIRAKQNLVSPSLPWLVLLLRVLLFYLTGLAGAGVFMLLGYTNPLKEITRWWGYQVIFTNIACLLILKALAAKEKIRFRDLIGYNRSNFKKDLIFMLLIIIPTFVVGFGGIWGAQFLFYGNSTPPGFYQPLPFFAALIMLILFPASNALIETTTYFGYSLQRIEAQGMRTAVAVIIASFFLSLQHIAIPLIFDTTHILMQFLGYLPLSLLAGLLYSRMRQLPPIMAVHFLADMVAAVLIFIPSLS